MALIVAIGSKNPSKIDGTRRAFLRYFEEAEFKSVDCASVARPQPYGLDQMMEGAVARARFALSNSKGDFGVGVEAGIFKVGEFYFDNQQAAVVDSSSRVSMGHSAGYMIPKGIAEDLLANGKELEEFAEMISGIKEIGDKGGLIHHLTKGEMTRADLTEQCVMTALAPWLHRDVYGF